MPRGAPLLVAAVLLGVAVLAGCASPAPAAEREADSRGDDRRTTTPGSGTSTTPRPVNMSKRWHFHNYWGTNDNLTLFEGTLVIGVEPSVTGTSAAVGAGTFSPHEGVIVPPETGLITVAVTWDGTLPERPLDLEYQAANMSEPAAAGAAFPDPAAIDVTEAMADAPHTGQSAWKFRLVAAPDERGVAAANGTVHVRAVAWIGRPIIIDPPHRDQWGGREAFVVAAGAFEGRAVRSANGYAVTEGSDARTAESLLALVPPNGTVVPEGARSILLRLDWAQTAALPVPPGLGVAWREGQTLTSGLATKEESGATYATFRIPVDTKAVDSPYTDRSAWRLDVVLVDGAPPAFEGRLTATAWVMKSVDGKAPAV